MMKKDVPVGMTKDIWFELKVQQSLTEAKGFDLVAMGRPEGPGCYCAANTLARKCLDLLTGNYQYIVIDNEAGMEHFSRLTTRDVDLLFIVSDSTQRGILTASRIRDLIHELDLRIVQEVLVINRVQGEPGPEIFEEVRKRNLELGGTLPADEEIYRYDSEGKPTFQLPFESKAVQAARRIFEKYIQ
jgi:CO dehydrogenase maturation factor